MEFFIDQFIGFRYRDNLVYAFGDFNIAVPELGFIAYNADDGDFIAGRQMNLQPFGLNQAGYALDCFLGSV